MDQNQIEKAARAAHEVNRTYCLFALDDGSQKPWDQAEEWQRQSARDGVRHVLNGATPQEQHEAWKADKVRDGWVYGETKDPERKTHPCIVPYDQLPIGQRRKDDLYIATVRGAGAGARPHEFLPGRCLSTRRTPIVHRRPEAPSGPKRPRRFDV
jgi:hypothetical protein